MAFATRTLRDDPIPTGAGSAGGCPAPFAGT